MKDVATTNDLTSARLILCIAINLNGSLQQLLESTPATAESNNNEIVKVQPILENYLSSSEDYLPRLHVKIMSLSELSVALKNIQL